MTSLTDEKATLRFEDGSVQEVEVPHMIHVEVGMTVLVIDVGDGKPIYSWGAS